MALRFMLLLKIITQESVAIFLPLIWVGGGGSGSHTGHVVGGITNTVASTIQQ